MKQFRKLLILLAILALATASAFAINEKVMLSPQLLNVDGEEIACEKYNINGSNYFKLRDIAMLLNETPRQFEAAWNAEEEAIYITSGESYTVVGGELEDRGDYSKSAVVSSQSLYINGEVVNYLSVYNIDGNNFFKLRDLGSALGFYVGYDEETNAAIIDSELEPVIDEALEEENEFQKMANIFGLPAGFAKVESPESEDDYINNFLYSYLTGDWQFTDACPSHPMWACGDTREIVNKYISLLGAFQNQYVIFYCEDGAYKIADLGGIGLSEKDLYDQMIESYEKAIEIHDKLHKNKKLADGMNEMQIAQVYYDYLENYNVKVGDDTKAIANNDSAYGCLVLKKAICSGRAAAFNLLIQTENIKTAALEYEIYKEGEHVMNHIMSYAVLDGAEYAIDWGNRLGIFDAAMPVVTSGNTDNVLIERSLANAKAKVNGEKTKTIPLKYTFTHDQDGQRYFDIKVDSKYQGNSSDNYTLIHGTRAKGHIWVAPLKDYKRGVSVYFDIADDIPDIFFITKGDLSAE